MSFVNTIWLAIAVIVFYWFFTLYVTPFFAWLSELGHTANERLLLSTLISITWAIGFAVGSQAITLQAHFEATYDSMKAFQIVMAIFSVTSVVLMLLPVFFIEERRYCRGIVSTQKMTEALRSAFRNRNFKIFVISDLAYWSALVFFSTGLLYYVTVLMKLEKEVYSHLMLVVFAGSFLFYVPVCLLARRIGKRKMLIFAFTLFCFCFASVFFLGKLPFSPMTQAYCLACMGAIPLAIFGILPNAIVADIAEADGILTGEFKAGMFFGARTFMQKMGQMIGALVFPSLLLLGKSAENDLGVRLTGLAALIFCLGGLVLLFRYNEKAVDAVLEEGEASSEDAVSGDAAPEPATP
jgi:Na+/melibiose symporter-like transporter